MTPEITETLAAALQSQQQHIARLEAQAEARYKAFEELLRKFDSVGVTARETGSNAKKTSSENRKKNHNRPKEVT